MGKLKVLDLFSGIGGFSLGLERTGGFETVAFCEINPFCRRVLAKHWPNVPCFKDVTTLRGEDVGTVDVICGGFPCQDVSRANRNGDGLDGERSGLWRHHARLVRELRPNFVVMENSPALLDGGLGDILGELASLGFDAEWDCFPASSVGAPHDRDRLYVVAYAGGVGLQFQAQAILRHLPNAARHLAAAKRGWNVEQLGSHSPIRRALTGAGSGVGDGLPALLDLDWKPRVHALGNAVVPQIPELIGHAILESMRDAA